VLRSQGAFAEQTPLAAKCPRTKSGGAAAALLPCCCGADALLMRCCGGDGSQSLFLRRKSSKLS
jgi:hypothetical protein